MFFEKHGPKTVVIGRFFAGLRVTVAWLAGLSHMEWKKFALYNALGGILWATSRSGSARTTSGRPRSTPLPQYGLYAAIVIAVLIVAAFFGHRIWARRRKRAEACERADFRARIQPGRMRQGVTACRQRNLALPHVAASFLLDFCLDRFVKEAFPWPVEPFLSVTIVGKK